MSYHFRVHEKAWTFWAKKFQCVSQYSKREKNPWAQEARAAHGLGQVGFGPSLDPTHWDQVEGGGTWNRLLASINWVSFKFGWCLSRFGQWRESPDPTNVAGILKKIIEICNNSLDLHRKSPKSTWISSNLARSHQIWLRSCQISPNMVEISPDLLESELDLFGVGWICIYYRLGRVAKVLEKKTHHLTHRHRVLGAETRHRLTGASVRAKIGWGSGGLFGLVGLGRVWTPLQEAIFHGIKACRSFPNKANPRNCSTPTSLYCWLLCSCHCSQKPTSPTCPKNLQIWVLIP